MKCSIWSLIASCLIAFPAAGQAPTTNINDYGPAEFGHGLNEKLALDGWISLFDGQSDFGWSDAKVRDNILSGGATKAAFGAAQIKGEVVRPGKLILGDAAIELREGHFLLPIEPTKAAPLRLVDGAAVRTLLLLPAKMQPLFNGKDLTGWKRVDHAKRPKEQWPAWTIEKGALHAVGGPGCVEYQERRFGDLILQVEVRMNVRYANGGLFFRSVPGQFMNGYEAQLYNRCVDGDVARPAKWATGAIDDRQNARRLISRDGLWFVQTVIATGPHLATWINGHQTVAWTDARSKHDNPRQGFRLEPGTIQLQAHDVGTDIEFRKVAAAPLD